jgi:quinoprotein glucose dehydrogenase
MHRAPALGLALLVAATATPRSQTRITPQNVSRLQVAWTYDTKESTDRPGPGRRPPAFEATPVYDQGRLYLSTPRGVIIALDADTGVERWRTDVQVRPDGNYGDFASRGVALRGDRIYTGTVDGRLVCLEKAQGQRCAEFGREGQIDLTQGLRRRPEWPGEYGVTSPPAVFRDLVIVGSAIADNSRARMASGEVRAFDARTGALRWTFHPLPEDADAGGANTWSRIVVDEANDLVFLPTGSASPDYFGGLRSGTDGYANSIVALRASTGTLVWSFQTVHHDLWDYDVASPPVLFPAKTGPSVAVGSKTGHLFLFERLTGKPLFPIRERSVPKSDVAGEQAAATQPFPERPPSLVPQQVRAEDLWGATAEDLAACRGMFHSLRNDGIFTPPSLNGSVIVPGNIGGLHWGGAVWDATTRLLIAPVNRIPAVVRLVPRADFAEARRTHPERETTEQDGTPYAMSRQFFLSPTGRPCVAPPWGELVAVQPDTGAIAWRVTLGDLRDKLGAAIPTPTGAPSLGGPIASDTGVIFIGATMDPFVRAFEAKTGRELWKGSLPTSARATPLLYTTSSGRQLLVIAAGGHDTPLSRLDTKLVAFALQ